MPVTQQEVCLKKQQKTEYSLILLRLEKTEMGRNHRENQGGRMIRKKELTERHMSEDVAAAL